MPGFDETGVTEGAGEGCQTEELEQQFHLLRKENSELLSWKSVAQLGRLPVPCLSGKGRPLEQRVPKTALRAIGAEMGSRPPGSQAQSSLTGPGVFSWVLGIV